MTKPQALDLLMLLSAIENLILTNCAQAIPDHIWGQISDQCKILREIVLEK